MLERMMARYLIRNLHRVPVVELARLKIELQAFNARKKEWSAPKLSDETQR
jgi:hypothetical protein